MNLNIFTQNDFLSALKAFFKELNVPVNYITNEPVSPKDILSINYRDVEAFQLMNDVYFVGMVDDAAFAGNKSPDISAIRSDYDGIIIFGVTLKKRSNGLLPTRGQLADITRAFNREFHYTPVVVIFKYDGQIAFANTERLKYQQSWREGEKAGKVSILRDINIHRPHRGHLQILEDLKIPRSGKNMVDSFATLYKYWQEVFSVSILNKKFYNELQNWYFWAIKEVTYPSAPNRFDYETNEKFDEAVKEHKGKNVIRLLTRILFIWFIKEKKLIPEQLFDEKFIANRLIKDFTPQKPQGIFATGKHSSTYYRAILQNLFFATLNQEMGKRAFRGDGQHQNVTNLMRYKSYFKDPDYFVQLMEEFVPFMNGGLFECLDKPHPTIKGKQGGDRIIYCDGFSDREDNLLIVPDYLFFDVDEDVDLSDDFGNKVYKNSKTRGLLEILQSYKFTITENTPIEEDVALDPELLGKVFENLLASYNPETKTTARKQTGSFYTPREIVNYMVDESLIAYLKNSLKDENTTDERLDQELHQLLSYDNINPYSEKPEILKKLIKALDQCTILDPACGSGAFPMGILQKMVHVLHKIDPKNTEWEQRQIERVNKAIENLEEIDDVRFREQSIKELKAQIKDIEDSFENNELDYGRKLYLIENCIYGVDIQPVATQISKLRFFISLIVDQKIDKTKDNFGIRPLPNLETKFVAANTLIDIEKPKAQLNLFENQEIKILEAELKKVRHKLFSSKSPANKRKLREEDKELRNKISELLVNDGWGYETARQLASWDPYDQNESSPFFNPEWMFDVKDGFDMVIGNPPYKILTKNNTNENDLKYFIKKYPSINRSSSKNLYILFIECAINFVKEESQLSFIVPEGLFQTRSYLGCVEVMEKFGSTTQIITFSNFVFENAVTGNLIFLYQKKKGHNLKKLHFDKDYQLHERIEFERLEIKEISNKTVPLKNVATTFKGMVVQDRHEVISNEKNKDIFLLGKNISKWKIDSYFYTDYEKLTIIGGTKKYDKHIIFPRILIRRTGDSLCCTLLDRPALTESTLYSTWSTDSRYSNLFLLGLLNSKLLEHYNKIKNITNQQGFPQILMTDLELLPIKSPNNQISPKIELLSKCMSFKLNKTIEDVLNSLVFELYFPNHMKEREVDVLKFVEHDIEKILSDKRFENLSDKDKENVIEQLQKIWSSPDNEVAQRMAMFKEKSPDILKPILES